MNNETLNAAFHWKFEAKDKDGNLKWSDEGKNLIVNTGLNWLLENDVAASTLSIGLTDGTPTPAAGDTMASHAGWAEVTAYSEGTRQTWTTPATATGGALNNTASAAVFTMSGASTVGGGFLTTDSTKGGAAGTLISVKAANEGDRALVGSDTLTVTVSLTYTSA